MSDQDTWNLFAAAWLARGGDPIKHGEDDAQYAARQSDMAARVAGRMLQLSQMQASVGYAAAAPLRPTAPNGAVPRNFAPATRQALQDALRGEDLGTPPGAAGFMPPPLSPPSEASSNSTSGVPVGSCQRAFNGAKRGDGSRNSDGQSNDCYGSYDEQGVCKVCRLPAVTPAELAQQAQHARLPPGAA
jgi:hypothetical protein